MLQQYQGTVTPPPAATALEPPLSPVERYLREQRDLSAVERFAQWHAEDVQPAQARYYSSLLPAQPPGPGQQYAFEVELDKCSGCKACVTACHTLNGLDDRETWRDVGLLIGGTAELPVLQHVTTACHHCLEPPCMSACPVDAYEKNPVTGIVKHLDDQCFGCQYCTLACPYDVPKYHKGKGIVRKCDMCSDRLAAGEAPACVQACPNEAIRIAVVNQRDVIAASETSQFLPGAHDPQYTLPTTNYKTGRVLPRNLLPADYYTVRRQHAHWPLVVMLALTQLSVGAFLAEFALRMALGQPTSALLQRIHAASAMALGLLAINASLFHLGRPLYAFRGMIGLRHSWLSREILGFALFAPLAMTYAALLWLDLGTRTFTPLVGGLVVATGLGAVFCSVMIYVVTRRAFWSPVATGFKFLGTTLLLGTATTLLTSLTVAVGSAELSLPELMRNQGGPLCDWLMALTGLKLGFELLSFAHLRDRRNSPLKRSALIMSRILKRVTLARFACGVAGGLLAPLLLKLNDWSDADALLVGGLAGLMFAGCLAGELLERYLFFSAVVAPKMPGGLTP